MRRTLIPLRPRSSLSFWAELTPESRLRQVVLIGGGVATALGVILIGLLPFAASWRLIALSIWLISSLLQIRTLYTTAKMVSRIRLCADGRIDVIDPVGHRHRVRLLNGTLILREFGWIRVEFENGRKYAELVRRKTVQDQQWHRFQLIWQQSRQFFGCPDGS